MKTKAEIEKQIENLLVAQAMMKDLPARVIVKGLECWREAEGGRENSEVSTEELIQHKCGSAACFGGWVAVHPFFQAQGIRPNWWGEPVLEEGYMGVELVSEELFGDPNMFAPTLRYGGSHTDAKQEVLNRIKRALNDRLGELELKELA